MKQELQNYFVKGTKGEHVVFPKSKTKGGRGKTKCHGMLKNHAELI